jgi:hypothetical protein
VLLEGLGKLKKSIDLIENRTRDLPSCSIVPQPTMLPCALNLYSLPDVIRIIESSRMRWTVDVARTWGRRGMLTGCCWESQKETDH